MSGRDWRTKTHYWGECEDCDWTVDNFTNGHAIAKRHATDYDHTVRLERSIVYTMNDKRPQ